MACNWEIMLIFVALIRLDSENDIQYGTNMKDFNYYAPTEVVFGKESEEQVAALVKKYGGTKVLVHYGGQSAVRSGLLDKICGLLQEGGIAYVTLGGVVPNPRLSLAQEGIELCRQEGVDFILAVGGSPMVCPTTATYGTSISARLSLRACCPWRAC